MDMATTNANDKDEINPDEVSDPAKMQVSEIYREEMKKEMKEEIKKEEEEEKKKRKKEDKDWNYCRGQCVAFLILLYCIGMEMPAGVIATISIFGLIGALLCDSCKNGLKNVKWTEHIGKVMVKEVIKDDDIVEQIFTIKTNSAIIDNSQNYTIKQNNDKFNIEVPNIKMSLSSPTNYTKYYILSCVFNYNNHINTFHIRFESIGCSFCNETKQYIIDDDETEMAHQDGFYISQKNDKIIWYSYPYSDKNNQYITNKDNTYCVYNITNDNWTLYIELGINTCRNDTLGV